MRNNHWRSIVNSILLAALASAILSPSTAFADTAIRNSIFRLNTILDKKQSPSDVDQKLLQAVAIIDKMDDSSKWNEIRRLITIPTFKYSNYYDELLYVYLAHEANSRNSGELEALWPLMSSMQDSVHLFPAMLVRLFSLKTANPSLYRRELSLLLDYIETAPPTTIIHGPMIEGNMLFGYKVREDFSEGDLPRAFLLRDYCATPRPLPGFSDDTQYIALLKAYTAFAGFHKDRMMKLAALYEAGGQGENAGDAYYQVAQRSFAAKDYDSAAATIAKSLKNDPANAKALELKKRIDLALVLQPTRQTIQFTRTYRGAINDKYAIEMNLTRSGQNLSGDYFYRKIGVRIQLTGTVDEQNNFLIREFDAKGDQTGLFKGHFVTDSEIQGTWSKPNGDKPMPFSLQAMAQEQQ